MPENTHAQVNADGLSNTEGENIIEPAAKHIEVVEKDVNVLLHQRQFHFMLVGNFTLITIIMAVWKLNTCMQDIF